MYLNAIPVDDGHSEPNSTVNLDCIDIVDTATCTL